MAQGLFSVGDLVELKSDSPVMTVTEGPVGDGKYYSVTWFSGKKNEKARFPEAALKKAEAEE
jgi:uncharacterized protein YodC (DUF2158 family)